MNNHIGDTNKMVSDTPRTDEAEHFIDSDRGITCSGLARQLERELNTANQHIKRLEDELMDTKNKYAVLVADVVLNEDRAERIKQLEKENDAMRADLLLWNEKEVKP